MFDRFKFARDCSRLVAVGIDPTVDMNVPNCIKAFLLMQDGYYQVSRKYCEVARLPKGKTGKEALLEFAKEERPWDAEKWVDGLGEGRAGDHFLRCYAVKKDLVKAVPEEVFYAFRRLGGGTYDWINRER